VSSTGVVCLGDTVHSGTSGMGEPREGAPGMAAEGVGGKTMGMCLGRHVGAVACSGGSMP
jgi:hypothetical protein